MILEKKHLTEKNRRIDVMYVEGQIKPEESAAFLARQLGFLKEEFVIIDFTKVDYIDSIPEGIERLAAVCYRFARGEKKVALVNPSRTILEYLVAAGLPDTFIFKNEKAAAMSFDRPVAEGPPSL